MFPEDKVLSNWIGMAKDQIQFQGLPSRICWLGYGQRAKFGVKLNSMVSSGVLSAPVVIGRDHLDCGSVASPFRETESMMDGSDAVADWPLLNALLNTASGATWVSIHQGGGVGMGLSIHAGQVICVDGSEDMAIRAKRVLTNDPAMGIFRHVDAGYPDAIDNARAWDVDIPKIISTMYSDIELHNIGSLPIFDGKELHYEKNTSIQVKDGIITNIGSPATAKSIDCKGKLVTPGFVDSHTHPIFDNTRNSEHQQRLSGVSYEEIAKNGGGIVSSINGVRMSSVEELYLKALKEWIGLYP